MFAFSTFARRGGALVSAITRTGRRPRFALRKTGILQPKQRNLNKATTTTTPLVPFRKWRMGQGSGAVRLLCGGVGLAAAAGGGWIGYQKIKSLSQEEIVFLLSRNPQVRIDAVVAKIVTAATVLMREQQVDNNNNNNNRAMVVESSERLDTLEESNSTNKTTVQSYYYPGALGRLLGDQQHMPDNNNHNNLVWQVHVIQNPIPNAFVSPQGAPRQIFITTGMLNLADTPDELALIMGHELAHVLYNHGRYHAVEEMMMLFGAVVCFKTPSLWTTATLLLSSQLYDLWVVNRRSRQHEVQADMLGLKLAAMAGFDTTAACEVFRKLAMYTSENELLLGGSTHPPNLTRYHYLKEGAKQENREMYYGAGLHHDDADLVVTRLIHALKTVHRNQSWGGRIRAKNVDAKKSNEVNSSDNDDDDDDDGVFLLD